MVIWSMYSYQDKSVPTIDYNAMLSLTREKIEQVLTEYAPTNPDAAELKETLKDFTNEDFDLKPGQLKIKKFAEVLQNKGIEAEGVGYIVKSFYQLAIEEVRRRLLEKMSPAIQGFWYEFLESEPNQLQIMTLLDYFAQSAFSVDIDFMIDKSLELIIDTFFDDLEISTVMNEKLLKLATKDKLKDVSQMLDDGKTEEAINIILNA